MGAINGILMGVYAVVLVAIQNRIGRDSQSLYTYRAYMTGKWVNYSML